MKTETLIIRVSPEARKHIEWLLSRIKEEVEILTLEDLEDFLLSEAIREGDKGNYVEEEKIFSLLEGNQS